MFYNQLYQSLEVFENAGNKICINYWNNAGEKKNQKLTQEQRPS